MRVRIRKLNAQQRDKSAHKYIHMESAKTSGKSCVIAHKIVPPETSECGARDEKPSGAIRGQFGCSGPGEGERERERERQ